MDRRDNFEQLGSVHLCRISSFQTQLRSDYICQAFVVPHFLLPCASFFPASSSVRLPPLLPTILALAPHLCLLFPSAWPGPWPLACSYCSCCWPAVLSLGRFLRPLGMRSRPSDSCTRVLPLRSLFKSRLISVFRPSSWP